MTAPSRIRGLQLGTESRCVVVGGVGLATLEATHRDVACPRFIPQVKAGIPIQTTDNPEGVQHYHKQRLLVTLHEHPSDNAREAGSVLPGILELKEVRGLRPQHACALWRPLPNLVASLPPACGRFPGCKVPSTECSEDAGH